MKRVMLITGFLALAPLLLAACLLPVLEPAGSLPDLPIFIGLLLKEICAGVVLALSASALFAALRMGGSLADEARGASRARARRPPQQGTCMIITVSVVVGTGG